MRPYAALPAKTELEVPRGKHGILFDCHNLYHSAKAHGFFNYGAAYKLFGGNVKEAILFFASDDSKAERRIAQLFPEAKLRCEVRPTFLINGRIKANCDIDIAVAAFDLVALKKVKRLYLFSGDGDFAPMVHFLRNHYGTETHVVAFEGSISQLLELAADSVTPIGSDLVGQSERRGGGFNGAEML